MAFRFESRRQRVLPLRLFFKRLGGCLLFAVAVVSGALLIGVTGYHFIAGFPWIDALLNASMILTGMGPVGTLQSPAAKIFASCYALFSGLVIITVIGVTLMPILHRILHRFHIDEADLDESHSHGRDEPPHRRPD